jgi:hypothetical protein
MVMTASPGPPTSSPRVTPTVTQAVGPTATRGAPTEPAEVPTAETPPPAPTLSVADAVQAEFARLGTGRILYNPPEEMRVGEKERIEVRISMGTDGAVPLDQGLKGTGAPQVEVIPVSCFMKVRLAGEAFSILAFSSEEQVVPAQGYTEWAWDVTPDKSGEKNLLLTVTARVKLAGYADEQRDLTVIERVIRVRVNAGHSLGAFLKDNQGWIFPSVLVPVAAALGSWLLKRRKKRKRPRAPGPGQD